MSDPLHVPALHCPIPRPARPHADVVEKEVVAWMTRFGLVRGAAARERLAGIRIGWLTGAAHADGLLEPTVLAAQLTAWLTAFDDRYADSVAPEDRGLPTARLVLRLRAVMEEPDLLPTPTDPYGASLRDLFLRLRGWAGPEQIMRVSTSMTEYFMSALCQVAYSLTGHTPTFEEYVRLRRYTGICHIVFTLVDVARGFELPGAQWAGPAVRALNTAAADVIDYANDVLGSRKEHTHDDDLVDSLPLVLAHQHSCSYAEGLRRAADIHDEAVRSFMALAEQVRRDAGPLLARYVSGLEAWITAHFDWYGVTDRYRSHAEQVRWA
ncbi:terpene synthase family protein [Streptomyces sp. NPDC001288]|uniref:terpene synthase family protein n=1 Tax=Streptomyces sp. NPDC001297 TaxID=3364559 RepID=UPI0036C4A1AD